MLRTLGRPLDLLERTWRVKHGMERLSNRMMRELGVTGPQRLMVRCIGKFAGASAAELSELLHLDPGTVSAMLRKLESRGLIMRRTDPRDRRRATIVLTAAGKRIDRATPQTVEATVERCLRTLAPDDVEATMRVLALLAEALERAADHEG